MKAYKVELLVVDFDQCGAEGIEGIIENANYPNDCISPNVLSIKEADIGEWHDNHPLNGVHGREEILKEYFKE